VGWNWGAFLEDGPSGVTILFDQATKGIGGQAIRSALLIYKGKRLFKSFSEGDLSVDFKGAYRGKTITFPGLMRTAYHKASCQLPSEITLMGRASTTEQIVVEFKPECVVQLIAPNQRGLGETQLNQMMGKLKIRSSLNGIVVSRNVSGYMEFVGPFA
jgi:hypothetical protein